MTKEFEVEQDAEKAPLLKDVVTAGAILKAAREAKGLSLETVATQLHLRPKIINDLENDIFVNIASTTYVRGYIKNYARVVNADINQIQQCLSHQLPEIVAPAMQSFSRKTTHQARNSRLNLVTYLIVAVLIAMLVLWWVQKSSLLTNVDLSQPTVEEIAAESNMPEPQQIIRSGSVQSTANDLGNDFKFGLFGNPKTDNLLRLPIDSGNSSTTPVKLKFSKLLNLSMSFGISIVIGLFLLLFFITSSVMVFGNESKSSFSPYNAMYLPSFEDGNSITAESLNTKLVANLTLRDSFSLAIIGKFSMAISPSLKLPILLLDNASTFFFK
mgnify:CR=1 FL=1